MTEESKVPKILTPKDTYTFDYPEVDKIVETQQKILWSKDEFPVEKDVQDILVEMTEAERHGVKTVLKLFTLYELIVGGEYWGGRYKRKFKRPELQKMASMFSMVELCVHAPFYAELDKALMLNTDEHYKSYLKDDAMTARMDFIDECVTDENDLVSIGAFSMTEGAILYSNFAFLKHFQSRGKNLIKNICAGVSMSVVDENIHAEAGAWTYRQLKKEGLQSGYYTDGDIELVENKLKTVAEKIYEHECLIIDKIFEKGDIKGITATQLKHFVQSRLNICLSDLGIGKLYDVKYNPIADWFYSDINSYQFNDFFNASSREYVRDWSETGFVWVNKLEVK
jgi:ribonucleoside-diphosphate reductase beta chain